MKHRRAPTFCVWEITLACNTSCIHCGSHAGSARKNELDRKEVLDLCDAVAALGVSRVTLSGGEPLVRPDWPGMARRLIEAGVGTDMISNGIAIDERCARRIADLGLRGVTLSIDGTEAAHDELRGQEGAYRKAMRAALLLRREGVPVGVVTQVNRRNHGDLPQLESALAEAGVMGWQLQLTMPMGRCEGGGELVVLPAEVPSIIRFIVEASARRPFPVYAADNIGWMLRCEPLLRTYTRPAGRFFHGCHAGLSLIGLSSCGDVRGCLSLPPAFDEGNVRRRDLAAIWRDKELFTYNRKFREEELTGACRTCPFRRVCRAGCKCIAYTSQGSISENGYCARLFEKGIPGEDPS
ncbi:MAG: radical SAM protein [Pseudomonadota bacterium]